MADTERFDTLDDFLMGRPRGRYGKAGCCSVCGTWRPSLHRDHIVPKSRGGPDDADNIQLLCANCHQDKTINDMCGHPRKRGAVRDPVKWAERSQKLSVALRGKKHGPMSQVHREAHSAGVKRFWENLTPEERAAWVASRTTKQRENRWTLNAKAKANIAAAVTRRMAANKAEYGCGQNPETRKKLSEASIRRWAEMRAASNG